MVQVDMLVIVSVTLDEGTHVIDLIDGAAHWHQPKRESTSNN